MGLVADTRRREGGTKGDGATGGGISEISGSTWAHALGITPAHIQPQTQGTPVHTPVEVKTIAQRKLRQVVVIGLRFRNLFRAHNGVPVDALGLVSCSL